MRHCAKAVTAECPRFDVGVILRKNDTLKLQGYQCKNWKSNQQEAINQGLSSLGLFKENNDRISIARCMEKDCFAYYSNSCFEHLFETLATPNSDDHVTDGITRVIALSNDSFIDVGDKGGCWFMLSVLAESRAK